MKKPIIILASFFLISCSYTFSFAPHDIIIDYPTPERLVLSGLKPAAISIRADDQRRSKLVGHEFNEFGRRISSIRTVSAEGVLIDAFYSSLTKAGYDIAGGKAQVRLRLLKWENDFNFGVTVSASAVLGLKADFVNESGVVVFSKQIESSYTEFPLLAARKNEISRALVGALNKAMEKLFADQEFMAAIESAAATK